MPLNGIPLPKKKGVIQVLDEIFKNGFADVTEIDRLTRMHFFKAAKDNPDVFKIEIRSPRPLRRRIFKRHVFVEPF